MNRTAPAELVAVAFNLVLAIAWVASPALPNSTGWAAAHTAGAALPFLMGSFGARGRVAGTMRDILPLAWFAVFWSSLGALHAGPDLRTFDAAIAAIDAALFGPAWSLRWMAAMPQVWLSEAMHLAYVSYYLLVIALPLAFAVTGRRDALREAVLRMSATYALCFAVYLVLPVLGPARTLPAYDGPLTEGLVYRLSHFFHANGDASGTAFPSSHVAASVAAAFVAWRCCARPLAFMVAALAAAVMASTVYTGNHYPLDALAGLVTALVAQLAIVPALERIRAPRVPAARAAYQPAAAAASPSGERWAT